MQDTDTLSSKQFVQGWSFSLLLHLGLLLAAVTVMPKMTVVLEQEPFKWEVALIESPQANLREEIPAPVLPAPKPAVSRPTRTQAVRRVESPIEEAVVPRVAPQQSAQVVHPVIEPPPPQPVSPVQETVPAPIKPSQLQEVQKAEVREPEPVEKEPVNHQEAVPEPVREAVSASEPRAPTRPASEPMMKPHQEPVAAASAPPAPVPEAASTGSSSLPAEAPAQVAKMMPQSLAPPTSHARADHRWVGESLWRRVAELKRYPSSARLNGLEGRVILKAIIRADGHLAEVSVVRSSGHAVLDAAAMEAVKLACPLHMKQSIGPPQIVVSLPIVYSLAN